MEKYLEIKGYVCTDEEDVHLEDKPKDEYYYHDAESIGSIVADHFKKISGSFDVSPGDWTRGELTHYKGVFVQYYVADRPVTWEEAQEDHIEKMAGDLTTEHRRIGYSEWTITDSWVEIFIGGHDLRNELKSHEGKYVIVRVNYQTS